MPRLSAATRRVVNGAVLGRILGEQMAATRPFIIHAVERFRGKARAATGGWPLIVEQMRGDDRVIYLTFDVSRYPFADCSGMPAMWLALLGLGALPKTGLSDDAHEHQALAAVALESGALAYLGHLGMVGFYLGLLLFGHAAPSSVNRYLLRTVLLLAPVVFALLACAVFSSRLFSSGAKSVLVTVMEPLPGSGYALVQLSLDLFANRRVTLGWSHRGGVPLWWGIPSQPGEAAAVDVCERSYSRSGAHTCADAPFACAKWS